jgi:hypothetical protein
VVPIEGSVTAIFAVFDDVFTAELLSLPKTSSSLLQDENPNIKPNVKK